MSGNADEDSRVFDRPLDTLPDGGSLGSDCKRALAYPLTMSRNTFGKGGLLVLASLFSIPAPLLFGYALTATRRVGADEPLSEFDGWKRQYQVGFELVLVLATVLFGPLLLLAVGSVLLFQVSGETLGGVVAVWWLYSVPWAVGVFGTGYWREFANPRAWKWLVSPNYLATWCMVVLALVVGYVAIAISAITIVGPLFVTFYAVLMIWSLLGARYATHRRSSGTGFAWTEDVTDAATAAVDAVPVEEWMNEYASEDADPVSRAEPAAKTAAETDRSAATDDERSEYARQRERARPVDSSGPVERLETDDGAVRYLTLAADARTEAAIEAFATGVDRWETLRTAPEVATVHERGDEPVPWVAYDPGDGPLAAIGGDMSTAEVVAVLEDVEEGVATGRMYNVAHGAITPDTVSVERRGGTAPARERIDATVGDWGIERLVRDAVGVDDAASRYLAPEQFDGGAPDRPVDVYQIAAVTHFALLGRPPHADVPEDELTDPDENVPWSPPADCSISSETATVFERALAPAPGDRYDATTEFVEAMRNALG